MNLGESRSYDEVGGFYTILCLQLWGMTEEKRQGTLCGCVAGSHHAEMEYYINAFAAE